MDTFLVDRQLVSAFVKFNNIIIKENTYIRKYIIRTEDEEESTLLNKIYSIIKNTSITFTFEQLIELFEFVVSPKDKIVSGAVYTPKFIREFLILKAFERINGLTVVSKIADLSCGCGSFLFDAAITIHNKLQISYNEIFKNILYGLDIQEYSINRSKLILILLAITNGEDLEDFDFNLFIGDALAFDWSKSQINFKGFDIILGNPPYVCSRNIIPETKQYLMNWEVCSYWSS